MQIIKLQPIAIAYAHDGIRPRRDYGMSVILESLEINRKRSSIWKRLAQRVLAVFSFSR